MLVDIELASPEDVRSEAKEMTLEDIRSGVEQRLRWYGLKNFALTDIKCVNETEVVVWIRDLDRFQTYSETFETALFRAASPAMTEMQLAS